MKPLLYSAIIALVSIGVANAQCNQYYVLQDGSEWEYETYNPKGKLGGKNHQKVTSFSASPGGYVATVHSVSYDAKGKEMLNGDLSFKCENGTMYLDMRNFISEEQMKAFSNYEMQMEATNLEIPSSLSPGASLPDGKLTLTASGTPFPMKMTVTISNRKVEAKESVTTPAGTFDCLKITGTTTMESQMGVRITSELSTVEWIAPRVGTVKSESFNKNGKSAGYTVLSKRVN